MIIIRTSPVSGIVHEKDLDITEHQLLRYMRGEHIQSVFPHLSASDREFILTGTTEEEWNELFPPEEDEPICGYCHREFTYCECDDYRPSTTIPNEDDDSFWDDVEEPWEDKDEIDGPRSIFDSHDKED